LLLDGAGFLCIYMGKVFKNCLTVLLAVASILALPLPSSARKGKHHTDLTEILSQMNEASKKLHTLSANLDYTKVTVLVDDKSTESGMLYYRHGKAPEIRIDIQKPENKAILFKRNRGEIYLPKINQVQEYNLDQKSDMLQRPPGRLNRRAGTHSPKGHRLLADYQNPDVDQRRVLAPLATKIL
jgi:hypothetical protein